MDSVTIVGASLAGIRAAQVLRGDGFSGRITLIGEEPHKPYDRPPLSKDALADVSPTALALIKPDEYKLLDLDARLGWRATDLKLDDLSVGIVPSSTDADGASDSSKQSERVSADAVLIATGARPRQLPNPAPTSSTGSGKLKGIHTLRTIDDCIAIRKDFDKSPTRVVVVGAGFIGSEVVATARGLGLEVSLIEMTDVPMEQALGSEMGKVIADVHKEKGVDLRLNTRVEALSGDDKVQEVHLDDGTSIPADVVIVGIGVIPNTEWLESSGLVLDDGVVCDETCLAFEGVAAAGDVARWKNQRFGEMMRIEHWDNAIEQSKVAARRLLAGEDMRGIEPYSPIPWFWSDQYEHKIQLAGLSSASDQTRLVDGSIAERKFTVLYEREGRTVGVLGFNSPRQVMQYRQKIEENFPI